MNKHAIETLEQRWSDTLYHQYFDEPREEDLAEIDKESYLIDQYEEDRDDRF